MSLNKRLQFLRESMSRNAGPKVSAACEQAVENQSLLATEGGVILHCPKTVPDATLIAGDGTEVSLRALIAGKPAVLLFFRGDWCPYSTTSMRACEAIRADLAEIGVILAGITPRHHAALKPMAQKNMLGYTLLTDPDQSLIEAMGVRSRTVEAMIVLFEAAGLDLARLNESGDWSLPLEATFLVDADGNIRFANAYPDPSRRMEPDEIRERMLEIVRQPVET